MALAAEDTKRYSQVVKFINSIKPAYLKLERTLGGLKFAVVIILLFAIALAIGTFVESANGTDYANRLIYKSIPFMALQGLMFLSIFFATTIRLPYKKALAGFYVLHLGLMGKCLQLFKEKLIKFTKLISRGNYRASSV